MWLEERFFTRGHLVIGHVLSCHGQMAPISPLLDAEDEGSANSGKYMIDLTYRFRSPAGETIKVAVQRQRNDLRGCRLPRFGNPVAVLYLTNKRYKLL